MADTKISDLTAAVGLTGSEEIAAAYAAANIKLTPLQIAAFAALTFPSPIEVVKLQTSTVDNTPTEVTIGGAGPVDSSVIVHVDDDHWTHMRFFIRAVTPTEHYFATLDAVIEMAAGVVSILGTPTFDVIHASTGGLTWTFTLTADSANSGVYFVFTGSPSESSTVRIDTHVFRDY